MTNLPIINLRLYGAGGEALALCHQHRPALENEIAPDVTQLVRSPFFRRQFRDFFPRDSSDEGRVRIELTQRTIRVISLDEPTNVAEIDLSTLSAEEGGHNQEIIRKANAAYRACQREHRQAAISENENHNTRNITQIHDPISPAEPNRDFFDLLSSLPPPPKHLPSRIYSPLPIHQLHTDLPLPPLTPEPSSDLTALLNSLETPLDRTQSPSPVHQIDTDLLLRPLTPEPDSDLTALHSPLPTLPDRTQSPQLRTNLPFSSPEPTEVAPELDLLEEFLGSPKELSPIELKAAYERLRLQTNEASFQHQFDLESAKEQFESAKRELEITNQQLQEMVANLSRELSQLKEETSTSISAAEAAKEKLSLDLQQAQEEINRQLAEIAQLKESLSKPQGEEDEQLCNIMELGTWEVEPAESPAIEQIDRQALQIDALEKELEKTQRALELSCARYNQLESAQLSAVDPAVIKQIQQLTGSLLNAKKKFEEEKKKNIGLTRELSKTAAKEEFLRKAIEGNQETIRRLRRELELFQIDQRKAYEELFDAKEKRERELKDEIFQMRSILAKSSEIIAALNNEVLYKNEEKAHQKQQIQELQRAESLQSKKIKELQAELERLNQTVLSKEEIPDLERRESLQPKIIEALQAEVWRLNRAILSTVSDIENLVESN